MTDQPRTAADAEHFGREEDRWHQDADQAKREAPDTPLDALIDALYEDRCLPPPQTDHALHVLAALRERGFLIETEATAAPPALDVERLVEVLEAVEWHRWQSPRIDRIHTTNLARAIIARLASADEEETPHEHEWGYWTGIHGQQTTVEECLSCGVARSGPLGQEATP